MSSSLETGMVRDVTSKIYKIGVLSSHSGTNLEAIAKAIDRGDLPNARIATVICNNPGERTFEVAKTFGIPAFLINSQTHPDRDMAIQRCLEAHDVDLVVLAGYNKKVAPVTIRAYQGKILNFHPGPLPGWGGQGMYGWYVHDAVLRAGLSYTGPTIHIATEEYDDGPVLAHWPLKVAPDDTPETLGERVYEAARLLYWRVIRDFIYQLEHPEVFDKQHVPERPFLASGVAERPIAQRQGL